MSTKAEKKAAARAKFEAVYQSIRDELLAHFALENMPQEAVEWFTKSLDYNVPGGKLNRGLSVVDTVEILKGRELNDEEYFQAAILGWCVELLQAYFLVADDIMDSSVTRRSQPCWYRNSKVGMIAINDSFMLEAAVYHLIKSHFRSQPYYIDLLELFHDITYKTEFGQLVDLITAPEDDVNLDKFSLERHRLIVVYKTAFYSFLLPVALAFRVAGVPDSYTIDGTTTEPYKLASDILLPLGEYFQVQDDFLDFSATPEVLGKIGTDIVDNKCSWCVNTALRLASPLQREILDANYGRKDSDAEARVKEVYEAVGMREVYREYEERVVGKLRGLIDGIPEGGEGTVKKEVFTSFLEKIYKRSM